MANLRSKLFMLLMAGMIFCTGYFSPPVKAQALVAYDTLKAGDSIMIVTVAPFGDDVMLTVVDSSDSVTDSLCVYEIMPVHYDTTGAILIKENAQFDSLKITGSTIFTPGQGVVTTYRLVNRQPWKLKIVRRNQNLNINHNTYIIIRARTKFYNAIPKKDEPGFASIEQNRNIYLIEDKYGKFKRENPESITLLPLPWETEAYSKEHNKKE